MKYFGLITIAILSMLLSSCYSNVSKNNIDSNNSSNRSHAELPAHTAVNQSIVSAEVEQIKIKNKNDFSIRAKILNVEKNSAYLSMASVGASYVLEPNFQLDDNKNIMTTDKNIQLLMLSDIKVGKTFNAIIFYDQNRGWLIDKVL
jgi:hypothetical protein